jgi:MoaA/NifB/PqqE/SkfB family radical SAM enzyme
MDIATIDQPNAHQTLEFLWVELTKQCNLQCVHCYADSGPDVRTEDALTTAEYIQALGAARNAGCRRVQFIGGEPTLFKDLIMLIEHSYRLGFDEIELFTNATRLSDDLLDCLISTKAQVATSFYSDETCIHDEITGHPHSFDMTVRTIERLLMAGVPLRVGIIVMEQNRDRLEATERYLRSLGVENIGFDRVRGIGRGTRITQIRGHECKAADPMAELCGHCWESRLSISPDGVVSPCIMSGAWSVGSIRDQSLGEILQSPKLLEVRRRIYESSGHAHSSCEPEKDIVGIPEPCFPRTSCYPDSPCSPKNPCWPEKAPCTPDRPGGPGGPPPCQPRDPCMPKH